jgi:drug/metabolite transporter (DMT)-like permease
MKLQHTANRNPFGSAFQKRVFAESGLSRRRGSALTARSRAVDPVFTMEGAPEHEAPSTSTHSRYWTTFVSILPAPLTAASILAYLILNLSLNYLNPYLLGHASYDIGIRLPVFYTFCHQVTVVLFTSIWCGLVPSVRFPVWKTWSENWHWLLFCSTVYTASIATNNASFATISLTVNTIIKSCMPFPTMAFSYCIEKKAYSIPIIGIVAVLVGGTLLAMPMGSGNASTTEATGYALVLFSMVATALRPVISSRLMANATRTGSKEGLTAIAVAFWDALIASVVLLPFVLIIEVAPWLRSNNDNLFAIAFSGPSGGRNASLFILGCAIAGFYGPATFYTIKLTSSLTFTILGSFKQLLLLVGAAAFVDHESDPRLWVGLVIVCIATAAYSYQNHRERSQREAAASKAKATEATPLRGAEKA